MYGPGSVIQGYFANGAHGGAAANGAAHVMPDWARERIMNPSRAVQPAVQATRASQAVPPPPQVRATPHGTSRLLPQHLASFPAAGGQPLDQEVRQMMESAFRTSFADVRVHVGPHAAAIGAVAFTHGTHIHFAPAQYAPHAPRGREILAHELAHVVQQRSGRVRNAFGSGVALVQDSVLETEARTLAQRAMMQRTNTVQRAEQRAPTLYTYTNTRTTSQITGKPQGPHTVSHQLVVESVEEMGTDWLELKAIYDEHVPSINDVKDIVKSEITNNLLERHLQRFYDDYEKKHENVKKLIKKRIQPDFQTARKGVLDLMNLHPLAVYAWKTTGTSKKSLKGKGEAKFLKLWREWKGRGKPKNVELVKKIVGKLVDDSRARAHIKDKNRYDAFRRNRLKLAGITDTDMV